MNTAIITGLISAAAAIAVCLINNHYQRVETEKKHDSTLVLINYQIEELKKSVEKHNNMIERTYDLEKRQSVVEEQIKVANHRLDDLEKEDDGR